MKNLLFEIGVEEVPASYIEPALEQMRTLLKERLEASRLSVDHVQTEATPRRLALFAAGIPKAQESVTQEVSGPPARAAFDPQGQPTRAALGFAKAQGVDVADLQVKDTPKGPYCFALKRLEGKPAVALLREILPDIVASLDFPKSMRWRDKAFTFARPIKWIVALFDEEVIPFELNGVASGRVTQGHLFVAPGPVELESADFDAYREALRERRVVVGIAERRDAIRAKVDALMAPHGSRCADEALLHEVTQLVEHPNALEGRFAEEYLTLPADVLESAMREHQKYFPVHDAAGRLLPRFITVLNRDETVALEGIRDGNERVLEARLSDARFFWEADKRVRLEKKVEGLRHVLFHEKLGSYLDRTNRLVELSGWLAEQLGHRAEVASHARRAAFLCKGDLVTQMVGEFPKLQGIMGREYARVDGEPEPVAAAIAEHYLPRFADDALPRTDVGVVLSLADKFDAIVACFSAGLAPSGSQDPYALRRQALGILRILEQQRLNLRLREVAAKAREQLPAPVRAMPDGEPARVLDFFRDRLYQTSLDRGYRYDLVNAALASGYDDVLDFRTRLDVLAKLSGMPQWPALVTVVERTFNIGKKCAVEGAVNEALLTEPAEQALWTAFQKHQADIARLVDSGGYEEAALRYHDAFAEPVHVFFDKVFVNVEDERVRTNRLLMLKQINRLFSARMADLSQIVPPDTAR